MTREQSAAVHATYVVETVAVTFAPAADAAPELDWRRIGQGAFLGALLGALWSVTASDLDSTLSVIAGVVNVATAFAIIGGLWGAVFFSPDDPA